MLESTVNYLETLNVNHFIYLLSNSIGFFRSVDLSLIHNETDFSDQ